jgi:hypothetical protein
MAAHLHFTRPNSARPPTGRVRGDSLTNSQIGVAAAGFRRPELSARLDKVMEELKDSEKLYFQNRFGLWVK